MQQIWLLNLLSTFYPVDDKVCLVYMTQNTRNEEKFAKAAHSSFPYRDSVVKVSS